MATQSKNPSKGNPGKETPETDPTGNPEPGPTRINGKERIMPP